MDCVAVLFLDLGLYCDLMGINGILDSISRRFSHQVMINQGSKGFVAIVFIHRRGFLLSIGNMREHYCQLYQCEEYSGRGVEAMEHRWTKNQLNQLLDLVWDIRYLVQNYGEDERIWGGEAATRIQSLLDWSEIVSQCLWILPPMMTKGSKPNITMIPPFNMQTKPVWGSSM